MMKIKLGTGGGLVVVGTVTPLVKINCIARVSELKELSNLTTPLSNVSLVVLNGLMFTGCPVPVLLENVSTVIIKNCKFMYISKFSYTYSYVATCVYTCMLHVFVHLCVCACMHASVCAHVYMHLYTMVTYVSSLYYIINKINIDVLLSKNQALLNSVHM